MRPLLLILFLILGKSATFAQIVITPDGPLEFCQGESVMLCVDSPCESYLWNTGSTTPCIEVFESGSYYPICLDSLGNIDSTAVDSPIVVIVHDPQPTVYLLDCTFFLGESWESYQWFFNSSSIPNATDSSYSPVESANYVALITDSFGCTAYTDVFVLFGYGCTGPDGVLENEPIKFKVFPNPANDIMRLDIEALKPEPMELMIMDILGRPVHQQIL
ncbi:MAG: hypothetical protein JKX84_08035, partial [Flavobacteriales bacterium]|nr:hypothetical protein [Flavobacteriales bacterium]